MDEKVYIDEILELQKESSRLKQDNVRLLSLLREYINKELKVLKNEK